MPEAPVNEYNSLTTGENQIRLAGQTTAAKSVSQALCMQGLSQKEFRGCVFAPDARHHAAARGHINNVGHASLSE